MNTTEPVLRIESLWAGYEPGLSIVRGASLEVHAREIVAILGPNGAGKSTLVKAVAGLVAVTEGHVTLAGRDITREPAGQPQLTFGAGIHYCLGASLARAELQEALPILARRMPNLALAGEVTWKPAGVAIWGPERLPISFTGRQ